MRSSIFSLRISNWHYQGIARIAHSILLASLMCTAPANSAELSNVETATLKTAIIIDREIVTLGDLAENTGAAADIPVFRAPDLGTRGTVSVRPIEEAARKAGITNFDTRGLNTITVERAARIIRPYQVHDIIQEAVADSMKVANMNAVSIVFDENTPNALVESSSKATPTIVRADWNPNTHRFEALIQIPDSKATHNSPIIFRGTAVEMINVAILKRPIPRGTPINSDDFSVEALPRTKVSADSITDIQSLEGISAKRNINAGQALRQSEVERTRKVQKNDMVTILYETSGITLSTRGKAMADGTLGDMITIQNTQSKKILEGKIIGTGMVVIQANHNFYQRRTVASTNGYIN